MFVFVRDTEASTGRSEEFEEYNAGEMCSTRPFGCRVVFTATLTFRTPPSLSLVFLGLFRMSNILFVSYL